MFIIKWRAKATRQFEKIRDSKIQDSLYAKIQELKNFPNCNNIKMLKSHKYDFRLRVGKYRVLFNVAQYVEVINIEEIKKRDEQTY